MEIEAELYNQQNILPIKKEEVDFSFDQDALQSETLSLDNLLKFKLGMQFRKLYFSTNSQSHHQNAISSNEFANFNRYTNILPYKHSIVKLNGSDDKEQYINANYINSPLKNNAFIATQGPTPLTFFKFWQMVWESKADTIFMLCKEKVKCEKYWPSKDQKFSKDGMVITFQEEKEIPQFSSVQRTFLITQDSVTRQVTQIHYEGWPDHGVPEAHEYPVIEYLVQNVLKQVEINKVPIIHCSAGVGRTGTLIALTNIFMILKYHSIRKTPVESIEINVVDIVRRMREQRVLMVQTEDQLELIYNITKTFIIQTFPQYQRS